MKPAPFEYYAPTSVAETVALLEQHGPEAKLLAGGQSLVPLLNMRLARPTVVVDVGRVAGLDYVREEDGALAIGAMTSQRTIERSELVEQRLPLLRAATRLVGHPQIRNRGTVGGSIAHADPAAEYPAVALALDAQMRVAGPGGERVIEAADFFVTYLTTALEPSDVLTEVRMPLLPGGAGWSIVEIARRHGDFALAGAVVTLSVDSGSIKDPRVVLFGVGATPIRVREAEERLAGESPSEALFTEAGKLVSEVIDEPLSDIHATAEFRRHLAGVMAQRGLAEAAGRVA
ncbi:MAG: xanthine dehydrogenase family protein subunit M [Chloroflexi bacterium]|nr:xanthine dehydrogenase family protein subunit M [Chloroflexota bacterium]